MPEVRGVFPFVLIMLFLLGLTISGRSCSSQGAAPAALVLGEGGWVELGDGFPRQGLCQISDDMDLCGVIVMTKLIETEERCPDSVKKISVYTGQRIDIGPVKEENAHFSLSWMAAGKRMALGITLHPDQMSEEDWQALPQLGEKLAHRIEIDRQENGDFGTLEALVRVKGVGKGKFSLWKKYFLPYKKKE